MSLKYFYNMKAIIDSKVITYGDDSGILIKDDKFHRIGITEEEIDNDFREAVRFNLGGKILLPGLIDCHTHIVYAGNRAHEFELRLAGATYEEIIKQGGGIYSTINSTQSASLEQLYLQSVARAKRMHSEGVTTLEIKSGYGLNFESEKKQLQAAKMIEDNLGIRVIKTFLIHVPPKDIDREQWLDTVIKDWIPALNSSDLIDMIDIFCDEVAFTKDELEKVLVAAEDYSIPFKAHVDQLSHTRASGLAAKLGASSLEHLEYVQEEDIKSMSDNDCVAVLLPGAYYYLKAKQMPPIDLFRKYHVPMAIATDCNPGSSPVASIFSAVNLAINFFSLTIDEVLSAITINAAKALELDDKIGTIEEGKIADFAVYDAKIVPELFYYLGQPPSVDVYVSGQLIK